MKILKILIVLLLSLALPVPVYANTSTITNEQFNDIMLLAKVINGEAGANWCSDEMRYGVGSVVANRVQHEAFPDTYKEVIYQSGQYGCLNTRYFKEVPPEHCVAIAADIIIGGNNKYPPDVVYQSNQPLGSGTYEHIQNMYFGYI